jgi:hypothetical protein
VSARSHHWPCPEPHESSLHPQIFSLRLYPILTSHSFRQLSKMLYLFIISPMYFSCSAYLILLNWITLILYCL